MRQITLILLPLLLMGVARSQGPSEADLMLMQSALSEWFRSQNPDPEQYRVEDAGQEAFYNPNLGLVLPTPVYWQGRGDRYGLRGTVHGNVVLVNPSKGTAQSVQVDPQSSDAVAPASPKEELSEAVEALMKGFLREYGDLARGLDDDEQVMLVYGQGGERKANGVYWFYQSTEGRAVAPQPSFSISAQVGISSIQAYRRGEIDREALYDRIEISRQEQQEANSPALRVLDRILTQKMTDLNQGFYQSLYEGEVKTASPRLWRNGYQSQYRRVPGYGVVFDYRFQSYFRPGIEPCDCPEDEKREKQNLARWDKQVDELQARVKDEIPTLLVQYGRTLRELKEEDWLEVAVSLPGCENCEAPAELHFQVSRETLARYDRGEHPLESAVDEVKVKAEGKAQESRLPRIKVSSPNDFEFDFNTDWNEYREDDEEE